MIYLIFVLSLILSILTAIDRKFLQNYLIKEYGKFGILLYATLLIPIGNILVFYGILVHIDKM